MSTYIFEKIKTWFRSKAWSAINCYGGFHLESPVQAEYGSIHVDFDSKEGTRYFHKEHQLTIENGAFTGLNMLYLSIYERKCYYKHRSDSDDYRFTRIPTDEFSEWEKKGSCLIQAATILKLAELIKENQKLHNNLDLDSFKNMPARFLTVPSDAYLIDVNCTREGLIHYYNKKK